MNSRLMIPLLLAATAWGPPPVQLAVAAPPPEPPRPLRAPEPTIGRVEVVAQRRPAAPMHIETRQQRRARERADQKRHERTLREIAAREARR